MSYVVVGSAVLSIGGSLAKGFGAMGNQADIKQAQAGAFDIYQAQTGLLSSQKVQQEKEAALGYDVASAQYTSAGMDIGQGLETGQRNIEFTTGQTGLATSGTMQGKETDLMTKYKNDMTKLFDTRELAKDKRDLSLNAADLAYRRGEMSADEAYQNRLTEIEGTPSNFWEGMFS